VLIQRSGSGKPRSARSTNSRRTSSPSQKCLHCQARIAFPNLPNRPRQSQNPSSRIQKQLEKKISRRSILSFMTGLSGAATAQLHREGRSSDARRRGIRRRGHRARTAELLSAGDQLWCDYSGRSAVSYEPHTAGATQRVVREDSGWPQEISAPIIPCEVSLRSAREVHRLAEKLHRGCPSRKAQDSPE
jgi:hypothetical protein